MVVGAYDSEDHIPVNIEPGATAAMVIPSVRKDHQELSFAMSDWWGSDRKNWYVREEDGSAWAEYRLEVVFRDELGPDNLMIPLRLQWREHVGTDVLATVNESEIVYPENCV